MQNKVLKYVTDRKKGVTQSKMKGADLLSVFLESQDMFTDDMIVKNLLSFVFAATETTNFASQTIVSILTQKKDSLEKVRAEFDRCVYMPAVEED